MKCDWCQREVEEVLPVQIRQDDHIDGFDEMIDDGLNPLAPTLPGFMQGCPDCVRVGFVRQLNAAQMADRHERRDRAERAAQRLVGG